MTCSKMRSKRTAHPATDGMEKVIGLLLNVVGTALTLVTSCEEVSGAKTLRSPNAAEDDGMAFAWELFGWSSN